MLSIPFNVPPFLGTEINYVQDAILKGKICGDGYYTKACSKIMEEKFDCPKVLLTTSGTHALEMSALLLDIKPGDEVIMPSFTFTSTANAFALWGAKIVFVDIRPDTQNIDETKIEQAITEKTKAIVVVHYAGVSCEMDEILRIASKHGIKVVEDAAQGVGSTYKGKALGTIGEVGCFSFHETKNYSMGEGGAILLKEAPMIEEAEVIREKGTNRTKFIQGLVDKYTWVSTGSSYLPSDMNAAYLYGQLMEIEKIKADRLASFEYYYEALTDLKEQGKIELPVIPEGCSHNAHMFYIKTASLSERNDLIAYLKARNISAAFHYVPLHSAPQGRACGEFRGEDRYTTDTANRLLRLPLYYGLEQESIEEVCWWIHEFYKA